MELAHMLPKPLLDLPKDKKNILLTNVQYINGRKQADGKYSEDQLFIVYRDMDTKKKGLQIISSPTAEYYTTKEEYRDDFKTQREFLSLDMVDKNECLYRNIPRDLFNKLKNDIRSEEDKEVKAVIDRSMELGKWGGIKEVHKWRHAYYSDFNIIDYAYTLANLHYKPTEMTLTKEYFDIECDFYNKSKYEIDTGACKITAMTRIYDYDPINMSKDYKPKVFTYLYRDHKRYPQQKHFELNMKEFLEQCHAEFDPLYGDADYHIMIFDDEAEMLYRMYQVDHIMKADFCGIWNMGFDIIYVQKKANYLGIPAEALFCHSDFNNTWMHYHMDEFYKNDFANRSDTFNCLSYTKTVDQMLMYAQRRKGGKDYGPNTLDNIARIELKAHKREWDSKSTNTINAAIREYWNFVLYNIADTWLLAGIERKVGDIDNAFTKGYDSGTRIDKSNRQTVALKNLFSLGHFEFGYVMGNNINVDYVSYNGEVKEEVIDEEDQEKLKGALVGNPTNLNPVGEQIFGSKRSDRLFTDGLDLDAGAMYPNNKMKNNIARSTQYGRLIIKGKVSNLEYGATPALRGGEFVDDYETQDWIKLGIKWFKLKPIQKYIKEYKDIERKGLTVIHRQKNKDVFFDLWSTKMKRIFRNIFGKTRGIGITGFLKYVYDRDVKDTNCTIYNNYDIIEYQTTLLSVIDWIAEVRPILTESGTFFKRHDETGVIPGLAIVARLIADRKKVKKLALNYKEAGMYELAALYNLKQNNIKVYVNSDYGVGGAKSSFSYNYHVAQSITSKGQTLISNAMNLFEDLLKDSIRFYDMDEMFHYMDNIVTEKPKYDDNKILNRDKTKEEVYERILRKCTDIGNRFDGDLLRTYLERVSQEGLNRLYYKSNIEAFLDENEYIQKIIDKFLNQTATFINPEKVPKRTKPILDEIVNVILEYCHYNYHYYGRIQRLVNAKRNCVIIIDTDSNIITVKDMKDKIIGFTTDLKKKKNTIRIHQIGKNRIDEMKKMKIINVIATILTEAIDRNLRLFEKITNTVDTPVGAYTFKNEFYFTSVLIGEGKKRYLSSYKLQEGRYFEDGISDIKGFDFLKISAAPEKLRNTMEKIIFKHIVSDNIDIATALKKFLKMEEEIRDNLLKGNKDYLALSKVKSMDSYADPFSMGQFKAAYVWNSLYPDKEIEFPNTVNLVKVNLKSVKDIAILSVDDREAFEMLSNLLKDKNLKTGVTQIAVPLDQDIPDWMIRIMNVEEIVQKYMKLVEPILDCLGIKSVYRTSTGKYISNIVDIG